MAVVVEAWDVVARRSVVEAKIEGGVVGWVRGAPNQTACADRHLCRVGFMDERDAVAFLRALERVGLEGERGGAYREVAILDPRGPSKHDCSWLTVGSYGGVMAAWLSGADADPLVVPISYRPQRSIINMTAEQAAERLEFSRREGNVEVFLDKQTGLEVYRGRTQEAPALPSDTEQRFQETVEAISPLLTYNGVPKNLGWWQRRRLRKGIRQLEALTAASGDVWRVWWFLGMARRSASDPEAAYEAFRAAYHANPDHVDVLREYAGQCLALGLGSEAVALVRRNCEQDPDDAGLRSNLALALVISGDMEGAAVECARAREMDPDDQITVALERLIDDINTGRKPRPTKYP